MGAVNLVIFVGLPQYVVFFLWITTISCENLYSKGIASHAHNSIVTSSIQAKGCPHVATGDLHLIKLCVGVEHPRELVAWQAKRRAQTGRNESFHITRMSPKRADELLDGGSLYWIMKGFIKARQTIIGLETVTGDDGISRCAILLNPNVVNTSLTPRRAFLRARGDHTRRSSQSSEPN